MSELSKMRLQSLDIVAQKRAQLKQLLPELFSEDKLDMTVLQRLLGNDAVALENEPRFGLHWSGKAACNNIIQQPSIATLKPRRKESVNFDETQNVFIEGDNLEVLKLLQKSYYGKVKLIYIDPPYNTGKEFIYPDKYGESLATYLKYTGQVDSAGHKFATNTEREGRYHSRWLSMMYPRLYLARNLLREDGVIFISIDDNEQANLKLICNEIFGEENFICCFNWVTKSGAQGMQTQNMVVSNHEYIICYARHKNSFQFFGQDRSETGFSNPDDDPRGPWKRQYLQRLGQSLPKRTIKNPKNGMTFTFETPYTKEKLDNWIAEDRIIFPKTSHQYPARKEFLSEYKTPKQLVTHLGLYATKATTEQLYALFNNQKLFANPKPNTLLKDLIKATFRMDNSALILDFFAGSGTTADAIMELNAEDGGNRRFICVQLPEPCDKQSTAYNAGYTTIADIGKERIRRAAKRLTNKKSAQLDLGFKLFRLAHSNFKPWESDVKKINNLAEQLRLHIDPITKDSTDEDLLYELLLKSGFELTVNIERLTLAEKPVFAIANGSLLICLAKSLTLAVIDAMAAQQPEQVICLDSGFAGNDQLKTNAIQAFKTRAQQGETEIILQVV